MIRQAVKGTMGFALILAFAAVPAQAKVAVDKDFKGSLLITGPDGNVSMLEQGEAPPDSIAANSVVEVFIGTANIATGTDEKASVACLGTEAALAGDCRVALDCGEDSGVLKVVSGTVTLTDANGNPKTLNAGDEYQILARKGDTAEPVAESTETALPADADGFGTDSPIDARNIQADDTPDTPDDTREEPASQSSL